LGLSTLTHAQISSSDKSRIVNEHNALRQKTSNGETACNGGTCPAAVSAMSPLTWDDTLARLAQDYANTCPRGHEDAPVLTARYEKLGGKGQPGENIAGGLNSLVTAVQRWGEDEAVDWTYKSDSFGDCVGGWWNCGHFTQIVWADTKKVGCGYNPSCDRLVCNYYPPGNYPWLTPYEAAPTICIDFGRRYSWFNGEYKPVVLDGVGSSKNRQKYYQNDKGRVMWYKGNFEFVISTENVLKRGGSVDATCSKNYALNVFDCTWKVERDSTGRISSDSTCNGAMRYDEPLNEDESGEDAGLSVGEIVLIVIGAIGLLIAGVAMVLVVKRAKNRHKGHGDIVLDENEAIEMEDRETNAGDEIEIETEVETQAITQN